MVGLLVEVVPLVRMLTLLRAQMASQLPTSASYKISHTQQEGKKGGRERGESGPSFISMFWFNYHVHIYKYDLILVKYIIS